MAFLPESDIFRLLCSVRPPTRLAIVTSGRKAIWTAKPPSNADGHKRPAFARCCRRPTNTSYVALFGRRVPIAQLQSISVENDELHFNVGGDAVSFSLGSALAQRWAKEITTPPPSLTRKLGISGSSRLLLLGEIDSDELNAAIAEAAATNSKEADLIIASVRTPHDLKLALARLPKNPSDLPPLWIVYPKGAVDNFGESSVREVLRGRGFIDTNVASVSSKLTALRFIWAATEKAVLGSTRIYQAAWQFIYSLASGETQWRTG